VSLAHRRFESIDHQIRASLPAFRGRSPARGGESIVSFTDLSMVLRARLVREDGQTMAEYGVVLAVIALTVIVAFTALSGGISNAINNVTAILNG
jgi:Flp pilus assembly pilin Flp